MMNGRRLQGLRNRSFKECSDWNSLFKDPESQENGSFGSRFNHRAYPPSGPPAPELSRPSTSATPRPLGRSNSEGLPRVRPKWESSAGPPPSPTPAARQDPALEQLQREWTWNFNQRSSMVNCLSCGEPVHPSALQSHLLICTAGKEPSIRQKKRFSGARDKTQMEPPGQRHDKAFVPNNKPRPWVGVLDEDPEEDQASISLKLMYGGGGMGFRFEKHRIRMGGSLGAFADKFFDDPEFMHGRTPRSASDGPMPDPTGFWARHAQRRRAENSEWEGAAGAFQKAREAREQEERERQRRAEESERQERQRKEREKREAVEAAAREAEKRKMAEAYEPKYMAFEAQAKQRMEIKYDAIPWPSQGGSSAFMLEYQSKGLSSDDKRKLIKNWSRRWHPDTWARYNIAAHDREKVLERVEEISKKINSNLDS